MSERLSIPEDVKKVIENELGNSSVELLQAGRYEELAEKLWEKIGEAKKFFPKKEWYGGVSYSGALIYVGEDFAGQGNYKSAIGYFEKVVKEDPKSEKAEKDLGMALICLGFEEKDISQFIRALELDLSEEAKRYASLALVCFGLQDKKAEYIEKASALT